MSRPNHELHELNKHSRNQQTVWSQNLHPIETKKPIPVEEIFSRIQFQIKNLRDYSPKHSREI